MFGNATPVERISSPPRRRWAISATSLTCTQRTGRSIAFAAASIVGCPLRTCGSANISATVGRWRSVEPGTVTSLIVGNPGQSSKANGQRRRPLQQRSPGVRCSLSTLSPAKPIHSARKLNKFATHCSSMVAPMPPKLQSVCRSLGFIPSN